MRPSIENAKKVAKSNLSNLHTVQEWAELMGYDSSKYFSRLYRNKMGKRPKKALVEMKIEHFKTLINPEKDLNNYSIANEMGLSGEIALYKFIKKYTGKSPTEWKMG